VATGASELAHTFSALRAMGKEIHLLGVPELTDLELRNQADRYLDLREMREQLERQSGGRRVYPAVEALPENQEETQPTPARGVFDSLEDEL
jgi:uncharacterized LabA/DUF88 family protein